jgi:hypothetical protein
MFRNPLRVADVFQARTEGCDSIFASAAWQRVGW